MTSSYLPLSVRCPFSFSSGATNSQRPKIKWEKNMQTIQNVVTWLSIRLAPSPQYFHLQRGVTPLRRSQLFFFLKKRERRLKFFGEKKIPAARHFSNPKIRPPSLVPNACAANCSKYVQLKQIKLPSSVLSRHWQVDLGSKLRSAPFIDERWLELTVGAFSSSNNFGGEEKITNEMANVMNAGWSQSVH